MFTTQKIQSFSLSAILLHTLLIGCTAPSESESLLDGEISPATDTHNTLAAPVLVDNEVYDFVLNEGVINIDAFSEVRNIEVSEGSACRRNAVDRTPGDKLRFGFACTEVEMTYSNRSGLVLEEGSLIFSARHRFMGRVVRIRNPFRLAKNIFLEAVELDEIFARLRIEANIPVSPQENAPVDQTNSPLGIVRQALFVSTGRDFELSEDFEHQFFTLDDDGGRLSGEIELTGNVAMVMNLGAFVDEADKYVRISLNLEAHSEGTVEINFEDDFQQSSESESTFAAIPLRFGWLYADLVFEIKAGLEAKIEGRVNHQFTFQSTERITSQSTWSPDAGWMTHIDEERDPWNLEAEFEAAGEASMSAHVGLNTTLSLFKTMGVAVGITPKVEAIAKGRVEITDANDVSTLETESCVEIKGKVELSVNGKAVGFDDQTLLEKDLVEHSFYEVGECTEDENEADSLPFPFDPDNTGVQLSCTSEFWSICDEYAGLHEQAFEIMTKDCLERGRVPSPTPCPDSGTMIGTCANSVSGRTTHYYAGRFSCLENLNISSHPMCNPFSEFPDEDPVWTWGPACSHRFAFSD